ncbi:MAG: ATP-binding cassette domain-containing protein [Candidatus Limnocylindria bacterium]
MANATSVQPRADSATGPAAGSAVSLQGLWREFGDQAVLRDVTLEIPVGATVAVLGPNGAGKTTLLRILATLLRPTGGRVSVLGCELPRDAWRARGRIGYVGHEPLLYRDLTCAENLRFQATLHGLENGGAERIETLLDRVRMSARANELVRNLSAGMVQRLAVCRALLHEPELLLLDEPRSHLDPEAATLVEPLIGPAADRTRVIVTHDVEAGLAEGDLVCALRAGGSVAYAGPASGLSTGDARAIYGGSP